MILCQNSGRQSAIFGIFIITLLRRRSILFARSPYSIFKMQYSFALMNRESSLNLILFPMRTSGLGLRRTSKENWISFHISSETYIRLRCSLENVFSLAICPTLILLHKKINFIYFMKFFQRETFKLFSFQFLDSIGFLYN